MARKPGSGDNLHGDYTDENANPKASDEPSDNEHANIH